MILVASTLYFILALPLLASFFYSIDKRVDRLALSMAGLAVALYVIAVLARSISNRYARVAVAVVLTEVVAAFQISRFLSFYFQGESFNARFFFHFDLNTLTEVGGAYLILAYLGGLYLIVVAALARRVFGSMKGPRDQRQLRSNTIILLASLLTFTMIEPDFAILVRHRLEAAFSADGPLLIETISWQELSLNKAALSATSSNVPPGKNLLFVYLESVERIYTDSAIFPGLTPNIKRLASEGIEFTNLIQTPGTDWTVGGMVASQCGTPLLYPIGPSGNDVLENGFLDRANCLGDVLTRAGYRQVYLGGAPTAFAGKARFLRSHGYDEVSGKDELAKLLQDPSYMSGWGLYDDSLFDIAAQKYTELAASGQPFNLTVLTLDTHHPSGATSRSCPHYQTIENSRLGAIHCTDFLLSRFLDSIDDHPAWPNTVVVLLSDHLAMRNVAERYYPPDYDRKLFFTALNGGKRARIDTPGSHMDVAPTVLDLMEIDHGVSFLAGSSLVANRHPASSEAGLLSTLRTDAIEFINANLLTSRSAGGICDSRSLVTFDNKRLYIGQTELLLSVGGNPISAEAVGSSHAVFALLNEFGSVRATMTVNVANLPHVLYQFAGETFILVAPSVHLPDMLELDAEPVAISVVFGNLQKQPLYLGGADRLQDLDVDIPDCGERLEAFRLGANGSRRDLLSAICQAKNAAGNYFDAETGYLHLDRVAFQNNWFEAVLSGDAEGEYIVTELTDLGHIIPEVGMQHCHAYFGNSELIVPAIGGGQAAALRMRRISDRRFEFEVLESR